MKRALLAAAAVSLTSSVACVFDPATPDGAQISCGGDADCPAGLVCSPFLSRCVAISGDREAPRVTDFALSATRVGLAGALEVTVACDEPIVDASLLQVGDSRTPFMIDDDARGAHARVEAGGLGAGAFAVSALLVDRHGNAGAEVLGTLEVDGTAPDIEPGSVVVVVTQPPGTLPVADPPLGLGGSVDASFRVDDLTATVVAVRIAPSDVALALVAHTSNQYAFTHTLDETLADGAYTVDAELVDDAGNARTVTLATIAVVGTIANECNALHADGTPACTDADGDGALGAGPGCAAGEATDCDDTRALVGPGMVEVAGNGLDDDCLDGDAARGDPAGPARSIFVAPGGAPDAAGTRDDPLGDLVAAAARAGEIDPAGGAVVYVQRGTYAVPGRVTLVGSLVGGLDEEFRPTTDVSDVTLSADEIAIDLVDLPTLPTRISGLRLDGPLCVGVNDYTQFGSGPLIVADLEYDVDSDCIQARAVGIGDRPSLFVRVHARMRATGSLGLATGIYATTATRVVDSTFDIHGANDAGVGARSSGDLVLVRSRITVDGDSPIGAYAGAVLYATGNVIEVGAEADTFYAPAAFDAYEIVAAHNTIALVGPRARGVSAGRGALVGNVFTSNVPDAIAIVDFAYYPEHFTLAANAFDLSSACALATAADPTTCLAVDPCADCEAGTHDNTIAPAPHPTLSAIDEGASSLVALTVDGACRGAPAPAGAE